MFRRNFRTRFTRRPKAPTKWHREFNQLTTTNANDEVRILEVGDYNGNAALSPGGVTVLRTIVDFSVLINGATGLDNALLTWCLAVLDRDQAAFNPQTSQNLIDERVLDVGSIAWSSPGGASLTAFSPLAHFRIDCKQRVRLKDQELCFIVRAAGVDSVCTFNIFSSVLLRGDTN